MIAHEQISKHIRETTPYQGIRILSIKTGVEGFLIIRGSFKGGWLYSPENEMIPSVLVEMLTKGTKKYSKKKIREIIESRGATISFSNDALYVYFSIQCLVEDAKEMVSILAELLQEPLFLEKELALIKKQLVTEQMENKTSPDIMGEVALTRILYSKDHPNYTLTPEETITRIQKIKKSDLVRFHKKVFGLESVVVVLGGDIEDSISKEIEKVFQKLPRVSLVLPKKEYSSLKITKEKREDVFVPDKSSVSFFLGQTTEISRRHEDYYALFLGIVTLGGSGLGSRLMKEVRDARGLTYGIYARMKGIKNEIPGYFEISGTFAPSLIKKGEEATRHEFKKWAEKGITKEEFEEKKENLLGSFAISLSTTKGLVNQILLDAVNEFPKEFIDEYPKTIKALTLDKVNNAIKRHINPSKIAIVRAGTLEDVAAPQPRK